MESLLLKISITIITCFSVRNCVDCFAVVGKTLPTIANYSPHDILQLSKTIQTLHLQIQEGQLYKTY